MSDLPIENPKCYVEDLVSDDIIVIANLNFVVTENIYVAEPHIRMISLYRDGIKSVINFPQRSVVEVSAFAPRPWKFVFPNPPVNTLIGWKNYANALELLIHEMRKPLELPCVKKSIGANMNQPFYDSREIRKMLELRDIPYELPKCDK